MKLEFGKQNSVQAKQSDRYSDRSEIKRSQLNFFTLKLIFAVGSEGFPVAKTAIDLPPPLSLSFIILGKCKREWIFFAEGEQRGDQSEVEDKRRR